MAVGGSKPIHVCLDARKLRHGGIGVYIQNAIAGLLHNGVKLTLLVNEPDSELTNLGDQITIKTIKSRPSSVREMLLLAQEVDWSDIDVFHTPNYLLPLGVPCPCVVTVHDLIHLRHPERWGYPLLAAPLLAASLLRAHRVVVVSRATFGELKTFTRFAPTLMKKVRVITNALSPSFIQRKPIADLVRTRFGLQNSFLLSVLSTVKPHKGVKDLLDAFLDLERRGVLKKYGDPRLVLVGQGTETLPEVERLLGKADALRCVRLLGTVSQEELFQLYAAARALIVPSFVEGFCLPVIEAQAVRTPVVTRPIPAVLDLVSPRDVVCRDFSVDGLVTGVERFLEQEAEGFAKEETLSDWQEHFYQKFDPYTLGYDLFKMYADVLGRELPAREEEPAVIVEELRA